MAKEEVQEARKLLKEEGFVKFFIEPTINYWKQQPLQAITTFFFWVIMMYAAMSMFQAVYFDTIYCDSSNNAYDGKVMYVFNDYVQYVNRQLADQSYGRTQPLNVLPDYGAIDAYQTDPVTNSEYYMKCEHDIKRWWNEPMQDKAQSIFYNFKKILLKRS